MLGNVISYDNVLFEMRWCNVIPDSKSSSAELNASTGKLFLKKRIIIKSNLV